MGARAFGGPIAAASLMALTVVMVFCTGIATSQLTSTSNSSDYLSSIGISCSSIGLGYGTSGVKCFVANNGLNAGYGYGYCAVIPDESEYVPSVGECRFLNASVSATFYTYNAGNGKIVKSQITIPTPNPIPVIKDVINNNNEYSPYLITCPVAPNPTNSIEYISDPETFIAGNRCLASILPLYTTVSLTTTIQVKSVGWFINLAGWSTGSAPTSTSQSYSIENMARGSMKNIGFSGQATVKGSPYNISSAYDTSSYIFQNLNASPQEGLWTWTAEYADLSKVQLQYLNLTYNSTPLNAVYGGIDLAIDLDLIVPIPYPVFVGCSFNYNFTIHSQVTNIANANVVIPVYNTTTQTSTNNYVDVGNYRYAPVTTVDPTANTCYQQMLAGGPSCQVPGTPSGSNGNWLKIGYNVSALYSGKTYNNLPVYINIPNNLDISGLTGYYGEMIQCSQQNVCTVAKYIPQSFANNEDGSVNIAGIEQYLGISTSPTKTGFRTQTYPGSLETQPPYSGISCQNYLNQIGFSVSGGSNLQYYCIIYEVPNSKNSGVSEVDACPNGPITEEGLGASAQYACYVIVSSTPFTRFVDINYMVPIQSAGTMLEASTPSNIIAFRNTSIFPYFIYNATIPSTYSQFTPSSFLGLSYSVYSPNNYASAFNAFGVPTTPVEPYTLFSGAGLLANYSITPKSSELAALPPNIGPASSNAFYDTFPVIIGPPSLAGALTIWAQYNAVVASVSGGPLNPGTITPTPPTIPQGGTVQLTLSGTSGGVPTYTYDWFQEIPGTLSFVSAGASDSSFYAPTLNAAGTWQFYVQVMDSNTPEDVANSPTVSVTVLQPTSLTVAQGQSTTLTGSTPTTGVNPYTYQWLSQCPGCAQTPIPGATSQNYQFTTNSQTTLGAWQFELQVTDSNTPTPTVTTEAPFIVTVIPSKLVVSPVVASNPTFVEGGATGQTDISPTTEYPQADGSVEPAQGGTPPYNYQWYEDPPGGSWSLISGATATVYTFVTSDATNSPTTTGTWYFKLQVTDSNSPVDVANSTATPVNVQPVPTGAEGPGTSQAKNYSFAGAQKGLQFQSTSLAVSPIVADPSSVNRGGYSEIAATITAAGASEASLQAATGGSPPYTYQWMVEVPGSSTFVAASPASPDTYLPYGFTATQNGIWTFELQVTDNSMNVADSTTATVNVTSGNSLALTSAAISANAVGEGDEDILTATCNSVDSCAVQYCVGAGCTPNINLATGTGHALYTCSTTTGGNICSAAGTFTVDGCDLNGASVGAGIAVIGSDCTGPVTLYVQPTGLAPPVPLPSVCVGSICTYNVITNDFNSGSGFIQTVNNGQQQVALPNTKPVTLNNQLSTIAASVTGNYHGTLGFINITNPAFITESPNGYVYVINYSSTSCFLCPSTTTNSLLFKLKYIPTGDYNYSIYQPSQLGTTSSYPAWLNQSINYFKTALLADTPSLYIVGMSQFTSTTTPNWCFFGICIGGGQYGVLGSGPGIQQNNQKPFIPLAAGADYQGDVFLVGAPIYGKNLLGGYNFSLAEISSAGTITVDTNINQPQGFVPSQEFAVSPGGQFLYLANSSYPAINIYSIQSNGISFQYVGNIPLSYSNSSYNMNIIAYLANGGPFYSPAVKTAYSAATPPIATMNDIPLFHHPLAITDVQGILYVVDDWAFGEAEATGLGGVNSYYTNPYGAIWMLRAFQENGSSEIPLEYSTNKTLLPVNPTTQIINPFQVGQAFLNWPPYGQPLSANISITSGTSPKTVSICEYSAAKGCNVRGNVTGYNSIGPQITLSGGVVPTTAQTNEGWAASYTLGISSSFDGRMYMIIHDQVANPGYAQLLVLTPEVDNYTVQEIGHSVPFGCYISTGSPANAPDCMTANYVADLYPPVLGMPDAFEYLTKQGGPIQYFSIPSALSALLPVGSATPGASSYNSAEIFNSGNFPGTTPSSSPPCGASSTSFYTTDTGGNGQINGVNYNSLGTTPAPGCPLSATSQLRTYINSTVNGYVITPYTITYKLLQGWDFSAKSSSGSGSSGSSGSSSSSSSCSDSGGNGQCLFEINILEGTLLESVCKYNGPNDQNGATTLYKNWVTSLQSNFVNQTIEGGNLYANNTATQSNYQPNLSDKNLIISPNTQYDLFTNRLLGEIFINQTISPSYVNELGDLGATLFEYAQNYLGQQAYSVALNDIPFLTPFPPKVINATRNYNYTEDVYVQLYYPTSLLGGAVQGGISGFSSSLGSSLSSWNGIFDIEGCASSLTSSFCAPAYLAENATPTGPLPANTPSNTIIGANCGGAGCPSTIPSKICNLIPALCPQNGLGSQIGSLLGLSGYYYSDSYLNGNNTFNYSQTNQTNYLSLFSLFHRFAYLYGLGLDLSNVPQIYGYNRLVYTYVDRFNNTISMPVAVDFANTTLMSINSTTVVNSVNVNQTQINVTGILLYQEPNGIIVPAPVGSTIYLYYDTNMNYFNTSLLNLLAQKYSGGGTVQAALLAPYNKWAENCAFNPQSTACTLANPLSSTGLAGLITVLLGNGADPATAAAEALGNMANTVTYQPNYVSANTCPSEPNSLLALSQYNCNIYGSTYSGFLSSQSEIQQYLKAFGVLPATGVGALGQQEYCVPEFSNGTGFLTAQLGLIGTVTTNSAGAFNDIVTACGTASGKIIAQYYGSPGPEPIYVLQPNLQNSNNGVVTLLNYGNAVVTPEYNYDYAPNVTSAPIQIGSYQLQLGNLYAWVPIIIILILLMASRSALGQSGGIFELFGFAALYDMAAGIGAGGGGKGKGLRSRYQTDKLQSSTYDRLKNKWTAKRIQAAKRPPLTPPSTLAVVPGSKSPPPPTAPPGTSSAATVGLTNMAVQSRPQTRRERAAAKIAEYENRSSTGVKTVLAGQIAVASDRAIVDPWTAHAQEYYAGLKNDNLIKSKDRKNIDALFTKIKAAKTTQETDKLRMDMWKTLNGQWLKETHHMVGKDVIGVPKWKAQNKALLDKAKNAKSFEDLQGLWKEEMKEHLAASARTLREAKAPILTLNQWSIPGTNYAEFKNSSDAFKEVRQKMDDNIGRRVEAETDKQKERLSSLGKKSREEEQEKIEAKATEDEVRPHLTAEERAELDSIKDPSKRAGKVETLKFKVETEQTLEKDPDFLHKAYNSLYESHLGTSPEMYPKKRRLMDEPPPPPPPA